MANKKITFQGKNEDGVASGVDFELSTDSAGNMAVSTVIDGMTPTQSRLTAGTYAATIIYGVRVITKGTGDLTMVPLSGDASIVITAAELTAIGSNLSLLDWYGAFSSVTAGAGMSVLLYRA